MNHHTVKLNCRIGSTAFVLAIAAALVMPAVADDAPTYIKAHRVYTSAGNPLSDAVIVVRDGKIAEVGAGIAIPDGMHVIELPETVVTPGLVDAMCVVDSQIPAAAPGGRRRRAPMCEECAKLHATHASYVTAPVDNDPANCIECRIAHRHHVCEQCQASTTGVCSWCELAEHMEEWHAQVEHLNDDLDPCGARGSALTAGGAVNAQLAAAVGPRTTWAEQYSEVIPHLNVFDSVNLLSTDFDRLLRSGVTTVFVSPDSASVIGTRGAIVKTGGPLAKRVVSRTDAVKATMASDPSRRGRSNSLPGRGRSQEATFMTRRPSTRMGVYWVFRKAFYDAIRAGLGKPASGADTPPAEAMPVLRQILAGQIPLRIQARQQNDIFSTLRLAEEFGLHFTLEEGTEAYQCLSALRAANVPVIYGPIYLDPVGYRSWSGEAEDSRLNTPKQLYDAGIKFALTAQEMRDEESLSRQAMIAVRYGLPADAALKAITSTPAELMGIKNRVGTLASGADADLVVWSGDPLSATARPLLVMINGQVVYEE